MMFKNLTVEGRVAIVQSAEVKDEFVTLEPVRASWMNDDGSWDSVEAPGGTYTDGSSIPRFLRWLYPKFASDQNRATVLHDWGYFSQNERGREFWDNLLYAVMKLDGASETKASRFRWAVKRFGQGAWDD